jgi:hypothetical protein
MFYSKLNGPQSQKRATWYQKTTDLSHNPYDDIINVVSCFLCDSANGRTWEMFLFKKTHKEGFSYYLSTKSAFLPVVTAPLVTTAMTAHFYD